MNDVIISTQARQDLDSAWNYLAFDVGDFDFADKLREELYGELKRLALTPGIGHFRCELAEPPVRFWRVQKFLVVYKEVAEAVLVSRILHESRDVLTILSVDEDS